MPVMPVRARAANAIFAVLRTTHPVVSTEVTSRWGWPICTAMNVRPARMAEAAAVRLRVPGVIVMVSSLVAWPGWDRRGSTNVGTVGGGRVVQRGERVDER